MLFLIEGYYLVRIPRRPVSILVPFSVVMVGV